MAKNESYTDFVDKFKVKGLPMIVIPLPQRCIM